VSPSWRNRIYIAFSPEHISLLKLGRGLKTKLQARYDEAIAATGKQPSWQAALDRLMQLFDDPEWRDADVNIVLSNRLVRYATMTFNAKLKKYSEQEAFARHTLTQTFGTAVDHWDLRIQQGKAGTPSLISAVDHTLLVGLRQACSTHKMALRSIMPYLMPVFNHYQKSMVSKPAWLVINEPGYSLLALVSGGEFVSVNGVNHDNMDELPMLLDRENMVGSFSEPCKTVYVLSSSGDDLSAISAMEYEFTKFDLVVPDDFPFPAEGLYAMAISGAL
jgi:hypothetical protein